MICSVLLVTDLSAQFQTPTQNQIQAGLGMTWIDNQRYFAFRLRPEFSISNVGIGLDLNLEFDSTGSLRKENFNEFTDYVSIIRYLRYGQEFETFYVKLGSLDYTTLGHGSIINSYNNSPSFDTRRIGMQFNLNFGRVGVQSMYGNFGQAGVIGLRAYARPLQFTSLTDVPILSDFEIGATYAADYDTYAKVDSSYLVVPFVPGQPPYKLHGIGTLQILGADIGLPLIRGDVENLELYADVVKILDFGTGFATGILFRLEARSLLSIRTRLERRFNEEHYLPSYFNSFYELERVNQITGTAKSLILRNFNAYSKGIYGDLLVRIINTFDIFGSYQQLDDIPQSGDFHLWTELAPKDAPVLARAGYDKIGVKDFSDLVITDDRALLYAELGYKPYPFLIVSTIYRWTYTPIRQGDNIVGYEPQRRIEPKVSFVYEF
ncbi:MAG: hypothetical protein E6K56_00870 [Ignavibacteria bacterium]|nr:MAG: hypothetical protein E6K56_00870 [Ignavibacteria bacterium]